jgi:DNA polymerase-1
MYGKLYGAGLAKLSLTAGVPQSVIKVVDDRMNATYPGMKRFQDEVVNQAYTDGFVTTPFGRKLIIADRDRSYAAVNYKIQGHAAELLKMALINMDNSGLLPYMMAPIHDEVIVSCPRDIAADVGRKMAECMNFEGEEYPVPLTAGWEGPFERWGDKLRAA